MQRARCEAALPLPPLPLLSRFAAPGGEPLGPAPESSRGQNPPSCSWMACMLPGALRLAVCPQHHPSPAVPATAAQDIPTLVSLPRPLPPGIPEEQAYIRMYCAARGLAFPLQAC